MKFAKITDASQNFSLIAKMIENGEDVILTKKGVPYALVRKMDPDDLEDYIVAKHFGLDKLVKEPAQETIGLEEVEKRLGL